MSEPNPTTAAFGPGLMYWAPLGTLEPTAPTGLDAGWQRLGFTETGSQFVVNKTYTDLLVAELPDPIRIVCTARSTMWELALAEMTAANHMRAMNGGTLTVVGAYTKWSPQATGLETRAMLLWISEDGQEFAIMRQAVQVGTVTRQNRKGVLSTLTCQFRAEIPATGLPPTDHYFLTAARAA